MKEQKTMRRTNSDRTSNMTQTVRTGARDKDENRQLGKKRYDSRLRRPEQAVRPTGYRGQRTKKRKRKRNLGFKIAFLILMLTGTMAGLFLWNRYGPTKDVADLKEYYGIKDEKFLAVIVDDVIAEPSALVIDDKVYVQYETLHDFVSRRFYWDTNENLLLYTLPDGMVSVGVGQKGYTEVKENTSTDYVILKTEGSTAYVALDFVKKYVDLEYELYDSPGRVAIATRWQDVSKASAKKKTQVRYQGGVKSPVLTEIEKNEEVSFVENEGDWQKICTKDGFIGYVKASALSDPEKKSIQRDFHEQEFTHISKDYVINMAWHNISHTDANSSVLQMIAKTKGLTTIVPTWFSVADVEGNLKSIASAEYVNFAHQSNLEVWVALRDFDGGIGSYEESYELLSHTSRREKLINQVMAEIMKVGADGINLDFEKISEECGVHFIQFVRELSVRCRQNGIVLSVDNYVPMGFNLHYDRKEQGAVADYVVIMGYDEHYAGSPTAGPVSSYEFVKAGIESTLDEVPPERVISGIPFFTRVWEEVPKTEEELAADSGSEAAEYACKVSSNAYGMQEAREIVEKSGAEVMWDDSAGQNFATWTEGETVYKVWIEDSQSIEEKLKLMKDNNLAGTAAWAMGLETQDIWETILKYVN